MARIFQMAKRSDSSSKAERLVDRAYGGRQFGGGRRGDTDTNIPAPKWELDPKNNSAAPEFFRPPPVREPSRSTPASIVSAPVSRDAVGMDRPMVPNKIKLSLEEREAARIAGISELEYAKQKIRLLGAKARGEVT
jgi:hypothetical protein